MSKPVRAKIAMVFFMLSGILILSSAVLYFIAYPAAVPEPYSEIKGASPISDGPLKIANNDLGSLTLKAFGAGVLLMIMGGFFHRRRRCFEHIKTTTHF